MNRDDILIEVFNDSFYKGYAAKLSPKLVDEIQSELIAILAEMDAEKLIQLHSNNELRYYSIAIIRNMVLNKKSPFNKMFNDNHNFDEEFDIADDIDEPSVDFDDDGADCLIADIYKFLNNRASEVSGAWYDEGLFKIYFGEDLTLREVSERTGIPLSSVYHNIKSTMKLIGNEFKDRYNDVRGE